MNFFFAPSEIFGHCVQRPKLNQKASDTYSLLVVVKRFFRPLSIIFLKSSPLDIFDVVLSQVEGDLVEKDRQGLVFIKAPETPRLCSFSNTNRWNGNLNL